MMKPRGPARLERSCGPAGASRDWVRIDAARPGFERMEARFAGHAFAPHRHDTYAIGVTLGGVQAFNYRGTGTASLAGQCFVLHPDELHDGRAGTETGFRYRILYVAPRLIQSALGGRPLPFVRGAVSDDHRLHAAACAALGDFDHPVSELELDALVVELADALAAQDPVAVAGRVAREAPCIRAVTLAREHLDAMLLQPVRSGELELVSGISRFALARQFRALLGTSPHRYLVMRRLDRVRGMIGDGKPFADAAAECGFADQAHMTRHFKKTYGISPGRWRAMTAAQAA